jgi:hypothetical protein
MIPMLGMQTAIALGGVFTGASLVLLVARFRPRWLGLVRPSSATERLETIRGNLLSELRELAEEIRTPPAPIRMERKGEADEIEQGQAA